MSEPEALAAAISATLLEVLRRLDRIEDRLLELTALVGDQTHPALSDADAVEIAEYSQSVMSRTWDPHERRWIYGAPE